MSDNLYQLEVTTIIEVKTFCSNYNLLLLFQYSLMVGGIVLKSKLCFVI